jgi:hypothetical protein
VPWDLTPTVLYASGAWRKTLQQAKIGDVLIALVALRFEARGRDRYGNPVGADYKQAFVLVRVGEDG